MKIQIINGANLNLLGKREIDIYGETPFESYIENLKNKYKNIEIGYFQSNIEGEIIDCIHRVGFDHDVIVINAGGYTHTSVSILDAIKAVKAKTIEVHISNIHSREEFRHKSLISSGCVGVICGFGLFSYDLAIEAAINEMDKNTK